MAFQFFQAFLLYFCFLLQFLVDGNMNIIVYFKEKQMEWNLCLREFNGSTAIDFSRTRISSICCLLCKCLEAVYIFLWSMENIVFPYINLTCHYKFTSYRQLLALGEADEQKLIPLLCLCVPKFNYLYIRDYFVTLYRELKKR